VNNLLYYNVITYVLDEDRKKIFWLDNKCLLVLGFAQYRNCGNVHGISAELHLNY